MKKVITILCFLGIIVSCSSPNTDFNPDSLKEVIIENGKQWKKALTNHDRQLISEIYDENAHYIVDGNQTFHGNKAITDFWAGSFGYLHDLNLSLETLEGTRDLLYETGHGTILLGTNKDDQRVFKFKYVNVWKLQKDGSYKVVIDMFNDVKK